jgi:protein phosphatase PTC7
MYHAYRYSRDSWAGEPETDPTQDYEIRERVEGWEMTPYECLELAYHGVLREKLVQAGVWIVLVIAALLSDLLAGSSTACLLSLNATSGVLRTAK